MKFWDTSAIVAVCVQEPHSAAVKSILVTDPSVAVWWATRTECISALVRQTREGGVSPAGERRARQVLEALATAWIEILPTAALRAAAERLLAVHPLRAADAFQLAAALQWCRGHAMDMGLVSFDARLRAAAHREGFTLLPAE
ncbi:MAG: type II toxin-antitoxin system VapC family toxin [Candidatus Rokubacteria bacterium]|nr:type II toxin-antitoxin system VapC family toxin [Candidatus Rokubacteria bacterium]